MKIVVATDSYKGTISASDAAAIIAEAFAEKLPLAKVIKMPIADGGEGSTACFVDAMGGGFIVTSVKNCYFEDINVRFGLIERGETAVIEVAESAGLHFAEGRKNPMLTTTYGVGQMIAAAAGLGVKRIWLCLGGSATNDLGLGAAAALGIRFIGSNGEEMLPLGGTLDEICDIDVSAVPDEIRALEISCLCDVNGTLTGETGAARMFSAQKGASPEMTDILERGAEHVQALFLRVLGTDVSSLAGGAAAGGMGAGMYALFGAPLRRGVDEILSAVGFDNALAGCDLVITGEGRVDAQSATGKAVGGVLAAAHRQNVPVVVIGGSVTPGAAKMLGTDAVFSTVSDFSDFEAVRESAKENLRAVARSIATVMAAAGGLKTGQF